MQISTTTDLRNETLYQLRRDGELPITLEEGEELAKNIGAVANYECSALTYEGLKMYLILLSKLLFKKTLSKKNKHDRTTRRLMKNLKRINTFKQSDKTMQ